MITSLSVSLERLGKKKNQCFRIIFKILVQIKSQLHLPQYFDYYVCVYITRSFQNTSVINKRFIRTKISVRDFFIFTSCTLSVHIS